MNISSSTLIYHDCLSKETINVTKDMLRSFRTLVIYFIFFKATLYFCTTTSQSEIKIYKKSVFTLYTLG